MIFFKGRGIGINQTPLVTFTWMYNSRERKASRAGVSEHFEVGALGLSSLKLGPLINKAPALQGSVQLLLAALYQTRGPHSELSCRPVMRRASPSGPSYGTLLFGSQSPESPAHMWAPPKRRMPDTNQGKTPAGKQLHVTAFESASTGLASWVDFVSFAVVLILSWACNTF